ncbi:MAG TPA: sigma-70 family RNA polymerase sigma factor [Pirellulales bacterium]|nr:sigma-70 family RNA polymerase sigma factor [Pirellulales bacterium]
MSEDAAEIELLSRSLGERLRRGDAEALKEVFDRFAPAITTRLKARFRQVLNDSDLDDVVSQAWLRLWTYRHRYDPERASLYTWFYLIARYQALDALRRRAPEPQLYLSDLSPAQRDRLTADETDRTDVTTPSPPSPELVAIDGLLAKLGNQDQRILLTFAEKEGNEAWATDLAGEWKVPASTVRSKKRRAMQRLRDGLTNQGFTLTRGEKKMAELARRQKQGAPVEQGVAAVHPQLNPLPAPTTFLDQHALEVDQLVQGLREYRQAFPALDAGQGFPHFSELWNRAYDRDGLNDQGQRQFLVDMYRWLLERKTTEDAYRLRLGDFIHFAFDANEELQQSSFAREGETERLERVERSMAGLSRELEDLQPEELPYKGRVPLHARWTDRDMEFSWEENSENRLSLLAIASQAFSLYGELPMSTSGCLASLFVENVRTEHLLLPPHFDFPRGGEGVAPDHWVWSPSGAELPEVALPAWIENDEPSDDAFPNPFELDLRSRHPTLADLLDKLLIEAALSDLRDQPQAVIVSSEEQLPQISAVEQLIDRVAVACDVARNEVADLFYRSLRRRQAHVDSPRECHANTEALQFLWSQLNEQPS